MVTPLGRWAAVVKLSVLAVATLVMGTGAWAQIGPPANDNFSAAQLLVGEYGRVDYGSVTNDNSGATAEPGEPNHAGQVPTATLWYRWTASSDAPVEFDTFNSGVPTVLAVYLGNTLANLNQLVANVSINPVNPRNADGSGLNPINAYNATSGVKFNAKRGVTYYIAAGSRPGGRRGSIVLSWAYHSSGVFRLSADTYTCSETESHDPIPGNNAGQSARGARITVTRLFGASGKVHVDFTLSDGVPNPPYTNAATLGTDFTFPAQTTLTFDDYEMSKSFIIPIRDDGGFGSIANGNPGRMGIGQLNRTFNVTLTDVRLDGLENTNVLSKPRLDTDHTNAVVTILDMDIAMGYPPIFTNDIGNFERRYYRIPETVGTADIPVFRVDIGGASVETHYVIDSTTAPGSNTRYDTFDLQAGSDYASPAWADTPASKNP
ncbi:MAG TPA: hypothetical protein VNZ22_06525, partial [Bacillota bacterium]|nr:hypothetical protein [Bacillota bacterium]